MTYTCETKTLKVGDIWNYYINDIIIKPNIQRQKCWIKYSHPKKTNIHDFILFMKKTKNTVNPLLFVEKIMDGKKKHIIIDGNNRLNAIISFIKHPFDIFPEYLPNEITDKIKNNISNKTYEEILSRDFIRLCTTDGININLVYDIQDIFSDFKFMDIRVPITLFENINDKDIIEIYEGVNRGGIKLTRQEILTATTSGIIYNHDIINFREISNLMIEYYKKMNDYEEIKTSFEHLDNSMNLFEILFGFQKYLHSKYPIVQDVGNGQLDMIFRCYEFIIKTFEEKCSVENLNNFLTRIDKICSDINNIVKLFYNSRIEYTKIKNNNMIIKKNTLVILIMQFYYDSDNEKLKCKARRSLLFHELFGMLNDKDEKEKLKKYDTLVYKSGGGYISDTVRRMENGECLFKDIPDEIFHILMKKLIVKCIKTRTKKQSKKRMTLNKLKGLFLSLYYNNCVPINLIETKKDLEHIIPHSCKWDDMIDIDRIGNLTLIDSKINQKRGNGRVTCEFIRKNELSYYAYPSEETYDNVVTKENVINIDNYNSLCTMRETLYIEKIIETIN